MSENIKIAIIDDHRIFLGGITMLLESLDAGYHVHQYTAPLDLLQAVKGGEHFDIILCDLIMNAMNGLAFLSAIRNYTSDIPVLVMSGINTSPPVADIIRIGGNGFVHKSVKNEVLQEAIACILSGETYFEEGMGDSLETPVQVDAAQYGEEKLSQEKFGGHVIPKLGERQTEVLRFIAQGATNKEIARALGISDNTVKTHLKHIFVQLGVTKRTACVRKAQTLGLL